MKFVGALAAIIVLGTLGAQADCGGRVGVAMMSITIGLFLVIIG
jgi:hypothetical protein